MNRNNIGLYIHVPFCKAKCFYCDFNSFPGRDENIPGYFDALNREIVLCAGELEDRTINSIFIGGGTPSLVEPRYIYNLLCSCRRNLRVLENPEISIETNPGTLSYEKLMAYKAIGINRISIGLQAWQNTLLKKLGRIHNIKEFVENYVEARKAGFRNINVDLIFGIPGQTNEDWEETLNNVVGLNPAHISCYSLKIEDETVFGKMADTGELILMEDEEDREMYYYTVEKLSQNGYRHYEISNFCKEGFECRHNLTYWKAEEYCAVGAGAHSYLNGKRYNNTYDLSDYIFAISNGAIPEENIQVIDEQEQMSEYVILGLRLVDGISIFKFFERFGVNINDVFQEQLNKLRANNLLQTEGDRIKLTALGLDIANEVFMEFI